MSNSRSTTRPILAPGSRKRSGSTADDYQPTTPRLNARFSDQPADEIPSEESTLNTPTRRSFKFPADDSVASEQHNDAVGISRENSRRSVNSHQSSDSQDIDMGDDDDDEGNDQAGSNDESDDDEKPSRKKKKGQRFYCKDFPPCNLSFTRSEHLARHIRKHTGERPFECHCSRRFSRLDNLRQHAQTVHVNEEIPGDSLAATGTRFQRQIRTDRVRPPNVRPRASTASSGGHGHGAYSRGHSRNLSASSVLSTTSSLAMSDIGESRPRPSPLMLNQDPASRARLSLDTFNPAIPNNGPQFGYYQSPSGYSSPTSSNFSTGEGSPRFQATMQSPSLPIARSSFYNGSRTPSRRLSVPSGASPYSPQTASYQPVFFAPLPSGPTPQYSNTNSMAASPIVSTFSHQRRESDAELEWRRRTWHPGTHANYASRPATSGLAYNQTPDDVAPALASQPAASQITRLPGIESFDHAPPPPAAPARNITSPMQIDTGRRQSVIAAPLEVSTSAPGDRRSIGWEHSLHQGLNRLEIAQGMSHPPVDPSRILPSQRTTAAATQQYAPGYALPQLQPSAEIRLGTEERVNKRQAWYGGPMGPPQGSQPIMIAHRTSPESSSSEGIPTPSTSQGRELHPAIMHANGMVELQPPGAALTDEQRALQAHYQGKPEPTRADSGFHSYVHMPGQQPAVYMMQAGHNMQMQSPEWRPASINQRANPDMGRLEALVAVATSENRAVEHRG
ncbi:hypothetical protein E4T43_03470 [Aureobasidium subglaciale]|nr:hypothetical protein E4T43_03470 [Aureobasidium subglaciale]